MNRRIRLTARLGCSLVRMFPLGDRSRYDSKKRMRRWAANFEVTTMERGTAQAQLAQQPPPFVLQLFIGDEDALSGPGAAKFGLIKRVATRTRLGVDECKVTIDSSAR